VRVSLGLLGIPALNLCCKLDQQISVMLQSSKQGGEGDVYFKIKLVLPFHMKAVISTYLQATKCVFPPSLERINMK